MGVITSMQPVAPPITVPLPAVSMTWRKIFEPMQPAHARCPPVRRSSFCTSCFRLTAMTASFLRPAAEQVEDGQLLAGGDLAQGLDHLGRVAELEVAAAEAVEPVVHGHGIDRAV